MNVVFIHGAWASKDSFNYISQFILPEINKYFFEYDCQKDDFNTIVDKLGSWISKNIQGPIIFVGHSLGGLIALKTANTYCKEITKGVLTISSPVKGIYMNPMIKPYMIMRAPILNSILSNSNLIRKINSMEYEFPILSVVSVGKFSPLHIGDSDGVLPLSSQTWKPKTDHFKQIRFENGHTEVLLNSNFEKFMKDSITEKGLVI
jgi:pimeloyl-ACP methyl ester carboxylesterase